ncbi:MAG: Orotate phosphoribosyltransferase [Pelotomaculum sp. PtaU1.Bin035]|nr:MAG: Orotate phosphoribosyltransferase [Pelotomaculum sp. PtaU1.Bin035]
MLTTDEVLSIFQNTRAMLTGHFQLTSGRHSDRYFQCAMVLQHPNYTETLCRELAVRFAGENISAVIGPATGGVIVSYEVARALGVLSMFAERENGVMKLRRGFSIKPGDKVLVVEDVITTGGSVREVIEIVKGLGGEVVGAGVLVDRSNGTEELGVRTEALLTTEVTSYTPEECPLCKKGFPVVKPGSRDI